MKVIDACTTEVVTADEDETLFRAAWLMRDRHVGSLVVTRQEGARRKPVGMLTDRDFVVSMVAKGEDDFAETTVGDAMTDVVLLAGEDDDVVEVLNNMESNGVRRMPVVDGDDNLVGIISYDDIVRSMAHQMSKLSHVVDAEVAREKERSS